MVGNHEDIRPLAFPFRLQLVEDERQISVHAFQRGQRLVRTGPRLVLRDVGIAQPQQRKRRHARAPKRIDQRMGCRVVLTRVRRVELRRLRKASRRRGRIGRTTARNRFGARDRHVASRSSENLGERRQAQIVSAADSSPFTMESRAWTSIRLSGLMSGRYSRLPRMPLRFG